MHHGCPHCLEQTLGVAHAVAIHGVEDHLTETLQRDGFDHDGLKQFLLTRLGELRARAESGVCQFELLQMLVRVNRDCALITR